MNRFWHKKILTMLPPNEPNRRRVIGDLGCGDGVLTKALYEAGYQAFGCDPALKESIVWEDVDHMGGLAPMDLRSWLTQYKHLDALICWDVLEHLPVHDLQWTVDHIKAALRPGGLLLAHVPNAEGLFGARVFFSDASHQWAMTPELLAQVLGKAGFSRWEILEARPIIHGWPSRIRAWLWPLVSLWGRTLLAIETGHRHGLMSQNIIVKAWA